ncbi:MAG TPA: cation transporter dimerization domain-containing protein, partial [Bacillaceae bacterium]
VEGVQAVHDLHVWTITSGIHALSAHIVVDGDLTVRQAEQIIQVLEHDLGHAGIQHTTLQSEFTAHFTHTPHRSPIFECRIFLEKYRYAHYIKLSL